MNAAGSSAQVFAEAEHSRNGPHFSALLATLSPLHDPLAAPLEWVEPVLFRG